MKRISEYRREARTALQGKWGIAVGTFTIYIAIILLFNFLGGGLRHTFNLFDAINYLIVGALVLGLTRFFLNLVRDQGPRVKQLFFYFTSLRRYAKSILFIFIYLLFIFLWTLLLIIPGIIKAYSYAMTAFILNDEPELSVFEAITKSRQMMDGYKWKLFLLKFSFIGWVILGLIPLGLGLLWVIPYMQTAFSRFYLHVKEQLAVHDGLHKRVNLAEVKTETKPAPNIENITVEPTVEPEAKADLAPTETEPVVEPKTKTKRKRKKADLGEEK